MKRQLLGRRQRREPWTERDARCAFWLVVFALVITGLLCTPSCVTPLPTKPVHLGMTWSEVVDARGYLYSGTAFVSEHGWTMHASEHSGRASQYGSGGAGWHYRFKRKTAEEPYVLVSAYYVQR